MPPKRVQHQESVECLKYLEMLVMQPEICLLAESLVQDQISNAKKLRATISGTCSSSPALSTLCRILLEMLYKDGVIEFHSHIFSPWPRYRKAWSSILKYNHKLLQRVELTRCKLSRQLVKNVSQAGLLSRQTQIQTIKGIVTHAISSCTVHEITSTIIYIIYNHLKKTFFLL